MTRKEKERQIRREAKATLILFVICAVIGVTQVYIGKKGEVDA